MYSLFSVPQRSLPTTSHPSNDSVPFWMMVVAVL